MSRKPLNRTREASKDLVGYLDIKDWLVITLLSMLTAIAIVIQFFFGNFDFDPLWVLTVVSVFFVYMRLRNQQSGSFPEYARVVPHFNDEGESDAEKFGLKNFGGPALNLIVYARVRTEFGIFDAHLIRDHETVHVDSGNFVPLLSEEFNHKEDQQSENLLDPDSELYESSQNPTLELFYTFESVSGRSHPANLNNPIEEPMEEIVAKYDSKPNWKPKQVRLGEIKSRAIDKKDAAMDEVHQANSP